MSEGVKREIGVREGESGAKESKEPSRGRKQIREHSPKMSGRNTGLDLSFLRPILDFQNTEL